MDSAEQGTLVGTRAQGVEANDHGGSNRRHDRLSDGARARAPEGEQGRARPTYRNLQPPSLVVAKQKELSGHQSATSKPAHSEQREADEHTWHPCLTTATCGTPATPTHEQATRAEKEAKTLLRRRKQKEPPESNNRSPSCESDWPAKPPLKCNEVRETKVFQDYAKATARPRAQALPWQEGGAPTATTQSESAGGQGDDQQCTSERNRGRSSKSRRYIIRLTGSYRI